MYVRMYAHPLQMVSIAKSHPHLRIQMALNHIVKIAIYLLSQVRTYICVVQCVYLIGAFMEWRGRSHEHGLKGLQRWRISSYSSVCGRERKRGEGGRKRTWEWRGGGGRGGKRGDGNYGSDRYNDGSAVVVSEGIVMTDDNEVHSTQFHSLMSQPTYVASMHCPPQSKASAAWAAEVGSC